MKRAHLSKIPVMLLVLTFVIIGMTAPAYGWKVKTHVYSANLILDEIQANNGYVEIEPFGKFQVKPEYRDALLQYPQYYRAGAMGLDVMPDIYVGQTVFHPRSDNGSGYFIEQLWNKVSLLPDSDAAAPAGDPANDVLRLNNKKQATAFILGFAAHAAGDFFGHSYINYWAEGTWPVITDGVTADELKIITRHNVVEAYIDDRIPEAYKKAERNDIEIPQRFIYDTMVTNGNTGAVGGIPFFMRGMSSLYTGSGFEPEHFKVFFDLRNELNQRIQQISNNQKGNAWDQIASHLTLEFAQKEYLEAWVADIDAGLAGWVVANGDIAQALLKEEGGMEEAKERLIDWSDEYLLKMLGAPDVIPEVSQKIGNVAEWAESLIPERLKTKIEELKTGLYNTIFTWAIGISYEDLKEMWKNPEQYLNQPSLFKSGSVAKLDSELGNFSTCTNALEETFVPFKNTLVFMKCTLIGYEGLDEMRRIAGSTSSFEPNPIFDKLAVRNVWSLDYGYNWASRVGNVLFGNIQEDINKVEKVIFNFNGTAPRARPTFTEMTGSPWNYPTGTGHGNDEYKISVDYRGAPAQTSASIGLYRENDMLWEQAAYKEVTRGSTDGSYYCYPNEAGRYQFRIYDDNHILLASSAVIEVRRENTQPTQASFVNIKSPLYPAADTTFISHFSDPENKAEYIALYKADESNPASFVPNSKVSTGTDDMSYISTPTVPGSYQMRAYDQDNTLVAQSNTFEVTGGATSDEPSGRPAEGFGKIELTLGNPIMKVNGVPKEIDPGQGTAPETKDGRTCLPIRAVAEAMGSTVGWDNKEKKVTLQRGDILVELWIGRKTIRVNGTGQTMDVAPYSSKTGRTMIPVRFAGESLGGVVTWDNNTKTATIIYKLLESGETGTPQEAQNPQDTQDARNEEASQDTQDQQNGTDASGEQPAPSGYTSEKENNNSLSAANTIDVRSARISGKAGYPDEDYFKFTLGETALIKLEVQADACAELQVDLLDSSGESVAYSELEDNWQSGKATDYIGLSEGTYYFVFKSESNTSYKFSTTYTSYTKDAEPNDDIDHPLPLAFDEKFSGLLGYYLDQSDAFRLEESSRKITVEVTKPENTSLTIVIQCTDGSIVESTEIPAGEAGGAYSYEVPENGYPYQYIVLESLDSKINYTLKVKNDEEDGN